MSWRERWISLRNGLLASPRFQARAIATPLLRGIARRRAAATFDLCAGFVYSQVLLACVRTGLLEHLAAGPRRTADLAGLTGLPADGAARLLAAATALDLVEPVDAERVALGSVGATLRGHPAVLAMVEHHALFYADLADPVALLSGELRDTRLRDFWSYAREPDRAAGVATPEAAAYSRLMSATQPLVTDAILDAVDLSRQRVLLDVGGGDGTFAAAAARRFPRLQLQLFDLPAVASLATERFAREGLGDRARACGGSFRDDPLPTGADVVTLVRVLHDHDDEIVIRLLASVRNALPPGGLLVIAEPMAGDGDSRRVGAAYFGLYLLAMGQGRPRTAERLAGLLAAAGFTDVRERPTALPLQCRVLTARREEMSCELDTPTSQRIVTPCT